MTASPDLLHKSSSQMEELFQKKSHDSGFAIAYALMRLGTAQEETWRALRALGNADACTPMGAIEALGLAMKESAETIASAIESAAVSE